jgi:hypothetical protein
MTLDTKPWIARQREPAFEGLKVAYEAAGTLDHDLGMSLVVGPIKSENCRCWPGCQLSTAWRSCRSSKAQLASGEINRQPGGQARGSRTPGP